MSLDPRTPVLVGVGQVNQREANTSVSVKDGETIILGGIIRNSTDDKNSGVPYLKDIPVLGYLFRTTSQTKKRQESIVLMRPTVLRTPELAAQLVKERRKQLPGISQAASENEREERIAVEREERRLMKENEAYDKAQEKKLFKTPDTLP